MPGADINQFVINEAFYSFIIIVKIVKEFQVNLYGAKGKFKFRLLEKDNKMVV